MKVFCEIIKTAIQNRFEIDGCFCFKKKETCAFPILQSVIELFIPSPAFRLRQKGVAST